jgi:hypothetical protein
LWRCGRHHLDGANITADGVYGPATAAAVLAYKQKRDIVNRSYQTEADNIVGKMTMASLDSELVKQQPAPAPRAPVQIKPLSASRLRLRPLPILSLIESSQPLRLNVASGAAKTVGAPPPGPPTVAGPKFLDVVLEMRRHSVGQVVVIDGDFGEVVVEDPAIVLIAPDAPVGASDRASVVANPQTFKVFSGKNLGSSKITVTVPLGGGSASIDVVVKTFFAPPKFTEGVNHAHSPSGRYADVQAHPNNGPGVIGFVLGNACPFLSPQGLVDLAKRTKFGALPIALKHLDHYLTLGKGADFIEDNNIRDWLRRDGGIKKRLKREIFPGAGKRKRGEGHFEFLQEEFEVEDFQFAFGAIDRVDFEVDFSRDAVRVWFQDRYEWHPVYPFYTLKPGDAPPRETNCLHAALVELKSSGAADYWMKGEGEVELSLITRP